MRNPKRGVTTNGIRISLIIIYFYYGYSNDLQIKNINIGKTIPHRLYAHIFLKHTIVFIILGHFISNV